MRILQVITSLSTGGAEKLVAEISPMLENRGEQVDVLLFDGEETPFKSELEETGIRVMSLSKNAYVYDIRHIFKLIPIIRNYDIVHTHNSACQMYVAIAKTLAHAHCKLVTTEHNTDNRRRHICWFKPIDKWMYRQYDVVISISHKASELLQAYIGREDIRTIENGVNVAKFKESAGYTDFSKDGEAVIAMVAAFRPQKDQDTLIKAMCSLPDNYILWLIGDGERREICEELVSDLKLDGRVCFYGVRTDIPEMLKASDIIVMSTHYEGMSLSNIEGMSVGRPFVASDVNGIHEITDGAGILFEEGNSKQLADEILHLMTDRDYYFRVAEACYQRAKQYDISKMVDQYEKVYKELMDEKVD